jgi:hypothetical protein
MNGEVRVAGDLLGSIGTHRRADDDSGVESASTC